MLKNTLNCTRLRIGFLCAFVVYIFTGCQPKLNTSRIQYNSLKDAYEYRTNTQTVTLRDDEMKVVRRSNYDSFIVATRNNQYRYPFRKRMENPHPKARDLTISGRYASVTRNLGMERYAEALLDIRRLERLYPEIDFYSDCLFLKGLCFERMNEIDSASAAYRRFLDFSDKKYSARLSGNRNNDLKDSAFSGERLYAKSFVEGVRQDFNSKWIPVMQPKYYYGSYLPGYGINPDGTGTIRPAALWLIPALTGNPPGIAMMLQVYKKLGSRVDGNAGIAFMNGYFHSFISLPVEIVRSYDDRFGLKISPVINYHWMKSVRIDTTNVIIREGLINPGVKVSAGMYLFPKMMIGGYYKWSVYNENNRYLFKRKPIEVWNEDIWDVSLYYNLLRDFTVKCGVRNGGFTFGLFLSGFELGFNVSDRKVVYQTDMY